MTNFNSLFMTKKPILNKNRRKLPEHNKCHIQKPIANIISSGKPAFFIHIRISQRLLFTCLSTLYWKLHSKQLTRGESIHIGKSETVPLWIWHDPLRRESDKHPTTVRTKNQKLIWKHFSKQDEQGQILW